MADTVMMSPGDNPLKNLKNGTKTESEVFADTMEWCRQASQLEHCQNFSGGRKVVDTDCTCLHALRPQGDGQDSTTLHMVTRWACYFASLDSTMRSSLEIEWIKHANFWAKEQSDKSMKSTGYLLQVIATDPNSDEAPLVNEASVEPFRACKHGVMLILGIGKKRWGASAKHALANTFPVHGLKGKTSNFNAGKKARLDSPLRDFFAKLHEEAEVPATRLVRELTGTGLRAGEEERTELPTHMTKRGLYTKFCWEQGWKLVADAKGKYTAKPRPPDTAFPEGSERKERMAWSTFLNYWKENYPNLKIRTMQRVIFSV